MTTYETILAQRPSDDHSGLELENAVNKVFGEQVTAELTNLGYELQGVIGLYQDLNLPNLWHVYDRTLYQTIALDYLFNVKNQRLHNKYEEVV